MNIRNLSLEQMAGQRIMAGFNGPHFNDKVRYLIDTLKVAGLILFKQNIETPDQVAELCFSAQDYATSRGQPPLFIAIDQEGGTVARLPLPFTQFPGNSEITSEEEAKQFADTTASELSSIGVNMNYAPVMDTAPKTMESVMAKRAFGDDPQWVSKMGSIVIKNLQQNNILSVAKHFPGIGRTTLDSHLDRPVFSTTMAELSEFDLIPFKAAISEHVSGIMLSHILYDRLDAKWPASLSVTIAKELLRNTLGYNGLIMTDDLDMGAIKKYYPMTAIIDQITKAQVDQILICHQSPDIEQAHALLVKHLREDKDRKDFEASVERILAAKSKFLST